MGPAIPAPMTPTRVRDMVMVVIGSIFYPERGADSSLSLGTLAICIETSTIPCIA